MPCCTNEIKKSFAGATVVVVPIPAEYLKPFVDVIYYDEALDKWFPAGWSTQVTISPGVSVTVDNGGPATGVVKIRGDE